MCFFSDVYKCGGGKLIKSTRLQTVSKASNLRGDGLAAQLPDDGSVTCHKNCISRYVSPSSLASISKREHSCENASGGEAKRLRSCVGDVVFRFNEHCLFCPDVTPCSLEIEKKTPSKYRRAVSLVATDKLANGQDFKQKLLDICDQRKDDLGRVVRERTLGAGVSDLHALDARYHRKCSQLFHAKFYATRSNTESSSDEQALVDTLAEISANPQKVWTSIEIDSLYSDNGGIEYLRRTLVKKVKDHFGDAMIALQSHGIATLLVFREHAPKNMKLVDDNTDDDLELCLQKVAKKVTKESKEEKIQLDAYNKHINKEVASACVSETLFDLLTAISPKFADHSMQSLMIGSIISSVITNQPTPLQIAIGILMSDHKALITELSKLNVTCSYDETRRFRRSAAVQASKAHLLAGMSDCAIGGLVQIIIDNFDTEISSQNCRLQCHNMAMLATQYRTHLSRLDGLDPDATIPRLTREEMKNPIACEASITPYTGPKKPAMPHVATYRPELTEEHKTSQVKSYNMKYSLFMMMMIMMMTMAMIIL